MGLFNKLMEFFSDSPIIKKDNVSDTIKTRKKRKVSKILLLLSISIIIIADALAVLVISYGMWEGLTWAWYLSIAGYIINIIIGIVSLFLQPPIAVVSILLNIAFILYFLQEHVKEFFEV
jgi:uncharacterized membrane protein (DUF2068 family)